ncbi:uncharacterized protein LOC142048098 [Phalacrocorax aristotelis]|uniref:uncharacterized protein LOC142048098 n=1 Tax=Phalacrocorax aristotelis TaxID=126867 RepID=UPI003F4C242A
MDTFLHLTTAKQPGERAPNSCRPQLTLIPARLLPIPRTPRSKRAAPPDPPRGPPSQTGSPPAQRRPSLPAAPRPCAAPRCRLCPAQAARTAADPGGLRGAPPSRRPSRRRSQPLRREQLPHPRPRGGCSTPGPAPPPVPPDPAAPSPGGLRRLRPPLLGAGDDPPGDPPRRWGRGSEGSPALPAGSSKERPRGSAARGGSADTRGPRTHPAASVGCAPRAWPAGRAGGSGRRTPSGGGGPGGGGGVPLAPPSLFSGLITSAISKPGPGCECGAPGARAAAGVLRGSPPRTCSGTGPASVRALGRFRGAVGVPACVSPSSPHGPRPRAAPSGVPGPAPSPS